MKPHSLLSKGMIATMLAQFFSAFADNAIFFAILAYIKNLHYPTWSHSALQINFVVPFIILAPFVGQFLFSTIKCLYSKNRERVSGAGSVISVQNLSEYAAMMLMSGGIR